MKLDEDYGSLNKINSSLLTNEWGKPTNLENANIGPHSEVVIDPVKPHTIDHLLDLIDDPENGAVILRVYNRQLLLITNDSSLYSKYYDYVIKSSSYVLNLMNDGRNNVVGFDKKSGAKNFIKEIMTRISTDKLNRKRPKWDVLIVKTDRISHGERVARRNKQGIEVKPKERDYDKFIKSLKEKWKEKCTAFLQSHQANNMNSEQLRQWLLTRSMVDEFTFQGEKYKKSDGNRTLLWIDSENCITYMREMPKEDGKFNYIRAYITFSGFKLKLGQIEGTTDKSKYSSNWVDIK